MNISSNVIYKAKISLLISKLTQIYLNCAKFHAIIQIIRAIMCSYLCARPVMI